MTKHLELDCEKFRSWRWVKPEVSPPPLGKDRVLSFFVSGLVRGTIAIRAHYIYETLDIRVFCLTTFLVLITIFAR